MSKSTGSEKPPSIKKAFLFGNRAPINVRVPDETARRETSSLSTREAATPNKPVTKQMGYLFGNRDPINVRVRETSSLSTGEAAAATVTSSSTNPPIAAQEQVHQPLSLSVPVSTATSASAVESVSAAASAAASAEAQQKAREGLQEMLRRNYPDDPKPTVGGRKNQKGKRTRKRKRKYRK
jgi:hypothetical protein